MARWVGCLGALMALLGGVAFAQTAPAPAVAIMPQPDRLLIEITDVPDDLSGPGHCLYEISQGGLTMRYRIDFDDFRETLDQGGYCVASSSDFSGPGAVSVQVELQVGARIIAVAPATYDPAVGDHSESAAPAASPPDAGQPPARPCDPPCDPVLAVCIDGRCRILE